MKKYDSYIRICPKCGKKLNYSNPHNFYRAMKKTIEFIILFNIFIHMKKSEIRKLVKEVLRERWSDFLLQPISNRKHTYNLYTKIDAWVDDMIDPMGKYIGPKLRLFKYDRGDEIIHCMVEPYDSTSIMYTVMEWNDAWAQRVGLSSKELVPANKEIEIDFYGNHSENTLGYFPTEQ